MLSWAYSEFQTFITYGIVNILSHRHIHCCFVIQEIQGVFDDFRVKALLHEGHFAVFKSSSDINCVLKKHQTRHIAVVFCKQIMLQGKRRGREAGSPLASLVHRALKLSFVQYPHSLFSEALLGAFCRVFFHSLKVLGSPVGSEGQLTVKYRAEESVAW